jgi:hypothetical protein
MSSFVGETKGETKTTPTGETKTAPSTSPPPNSIPPPSTAKVSKRFPTTKLKFMSAPAIPVSQMNPINPSTTASKQSLRSANVQLKWVRLAEQSNEFSFTNNCFPWNYPHPTNAQHIVTVTSITSSMILLQPELIPNEYKTVHGITKGSRVVDAIWLNIYSYLQPSYFARIRMKCLCRLFNDVEKMITFNPNCSPLEPIPLYTSFPHPDYASLRGLTTCLNALSKKETDDVPSLLLIEDGEHTIEIYKDRRGNDCNYVDIDFPITIIGESKDGCTIIGGLKMEGKKEDDVNVKHLTISQSKGSGVCGDGGMSFHFFHLKIEKSEGSGVAVSETKRNTISNCQVSHSKYSGVLVNDGLITMNGSGTSIHNNVTGGSGGNYYGLHANFSSSSLHLVSPLTKESISINNGGGGNYGGNGTIKTIRSKEEVLCGVDAEGTLHVKPGLNSLSNAVIEANQYNINQIFLENGVHDEKGKQVVIDIPVTIIGESKDGCTLIGGLKMEGKEEDDVNVKHLTISQSKGYGVDGRYGMSFHLFHLNIEKSEGSGVAVSETKRNTMSNCQVSHSKDSGVLVDDGLITMNGSGTSIHNNVTGGDSSYYGLYTYWSSATIHLVSPLTKESVSINNGGGGNYGGRGTIKTATENYGKPCKAENVSIGTNVNARFKTNGAFYPGKIKKMNTDGTYDITFDDGDERQSTPLNEMQCN